MDQIYALENEGSPCAIYKTNVQNMPEEAARFSIRSVPAMVLFVAGTPKVVTFGFKKSSEIRAMVAEVLCTK
jgi:thioredoxin-like negative regulator of GroEL